MKSKNIAIYLDFENLAISAHEVYRGADKPMKVDPILKFAEKKGKIKIKKVYADWSKKKFSQYQSLLIADGFELIHLPETNKQGKNGSDMRLVIDVMDQLNMHPNIDTVVIGSGDSDFIPLIQYMVNKENDVIVIGFEHSVSGVMKNYCTEFKSIESILGKPATANRGRISRSDPGRKLLVSFLKKREENTPVRLSYLKKHLLKADPKFNEKDQGHKSFKKFVKHWIGDLVEKVERVKGKGKEKDSTMVHFLPLRIRKSPSSRTSPQRTSPASRTKPKTSRTSAPARPVKKAPAPKKKENKRDTPAYQKARELVIRFVKEKVSDKPWALTRIKQQLLKMDPKFSEKDAGFRYFKHFINDLEGDLIEKLELRGKTTYAHFKQPDSVKKSEVQQPKSQQKPEQKTQRNTRQPKSQQKPQLPKPQQQKSQAAKQPARPASSNGKHPRKQENQASQRKSNRPPQQKRPSPREKASTDAVKTAEKPAKTASPSDKTAARTLLARELFYNNKLAERVQMGKSLLEGFKTFPIMTIEQMVTYIRERSNVKAGDIMFRKYVFTLKHGGAFIPSSGDSKLSGKLLKLKGNLSKADDLDGVYIEQVSKVLKDRFPKLNSHEILEVLF